MENKLPELYEHFVLEFLPKLMSPGIRTCCPCSIRAIKFVVVVEYLRRRKIQVSKVKIYLIYEEVALIP